MNKQPELTDKTRRGIIDAFWKLLMNREKLSVISVSRAAGVNRSTFYQYFTDMEDLREKAEMQVLEDVKKKISQVFPKGFPVSLKAFAKTYAGIMEDEGERLTALRKAAAHRWNVAQTEQYVERRLATLQSAPPGRAADVHHQGRAPVFEQHGPGAAADPGRGGGRQNGAGGDGG